MQAAALWGGFFIGIGQWWWRLGFGLRPLDFRLRRRMGRIQLRLRTPCISRTNV